MYINSVPPSLESFDNEIMSSVKPFITKVIIANTKPVIISRDISSKGAKNFYGFDSLGDMLEYVNAENLKYNTNFYEVLKADAPRKIYGDFDRVVCKDEIFIKSEFTDALKGGILSVVQPLINDLTTDNIIIFDSSTSLKWSFHFIINKNVFFSLDALKAIHKKISSYLILINNVFAGLDGYVYRPNQSFRLFGSCKYGKDNIKKLYLDESKEITLIDTLIGNYGGFEAISTPEIMEALEDLTETTNSEKLMIKQAIKDYFNMPESVNYSLKTPTITKTTRGIFINFTRLTASHCTYCDRIHDSDNTSYLHITLNNDLHLGCAKSTGYEKITTEIKNKADMDYLKNAIESIEQREPSKINLTVDLLFKTVGPIFLSDIKYCTDFTEFMKSNADIIALKSGMGTGKTDALAQILRALHVEATRKLTILSPRKSLATNNKQKFKGIDVYNYQETTGDIHTPKNIISPESLYRINLPYESNIKSDVVLDEAVQLMNQFTSSTFLNSIHGKKSWFAFQRLIKSATTIYLMDANLDPMTVAWIQGIRNKKMDRTEIYINQYQNLKNRIYNFTNDVDDVLKHAAIDLSKGKRINIMTNKGYNSAKVWQKLLQGEELKEELKEEIKEEEKEIKKYKYNILTITSKELNKPEVKAALADPNSTWGNYDCLICSPSVQSGVSYDGVGEKGFDNIYGIFCNWSNSSNDSIQQLNRVRHPNNKTMLICLEITNNLIGPVTDAGVRNHYKYGRDHTNIVIKEQVDLVMEKWGIDIDQYGYNVFDTNPYFNLIVYNEAARNKNLKNYMWDFLTALHATGGKIQRFNHLDEFKETEEKYKKEKKVIRKDIKGAQSYFKSEKLEALTKTKPASDADIEIIRLKLKDAPDIVSDEDKIKLEKYNIDNAYDYLSPELEPLNDPNSHLFYKLYSDPKKIKLYKNLKQSVQFDTFQEALSDIRLKDENIAKKSNLFILNNTETTNEEKVLEGVISYVKFKPKYEKHKLLYEWLAKLGLNGLDPILNPVSYTKDQLRALLEPLIKEVKSDSKRIGIILGLSKRKMHTLNILDEGETYVQYAMKWFNALFVGEFGSQIKKTNRNKNAPYVHENKEFDTFHNIKQCPTNQKIFKRPVIGRVFESEINNLEEFIHEDMDQEDNEDAYYNDNGVLYDSDDE